uniref:Uncharacterized protein LOC100369749 n=1 Tax=Saccoglossus kowalevskii TaxID=10224 RepID=A0ABM0GJ95_SACKO|nr:PREDICTED: uncharacterized protein LOC100369749 [Saccoglossus kowalevskii]
MTKERKNRRREVVAEDVTDSFRPPYSVQSSEFKKPWTPMGKSCFVTLKMREESQQPEMSAFVKEIVLRRRQSAEDSADSNEEEIKLTKRTWCAAPFSKSSSSCNLQQTHLRSSPRRSNKKKTKNPLQRAKWILKDSRHHIADAWQRISHLVTEGELEKCNAKLNGHSEVWLYCNLGDAEKVAEILQEKLLVRSGKSGSLGSWTLNYKQYVLSS